MTFKAHTLAAALLATACATPAAADPGLDDAMQQSIAASNTEMIAFRRDLHRHPELSGEEVRTAAVIAEALRGYGYDVRTEVGGHGLVATLPDANDGPLIAYRADMDAVRDGSPDPVDFASVNEGVRHICGHDMHVAIAISMAKAFAEHRELLPGSVMFVFQPKEESATGARDMLADDLFDHRMPDAIYGIHSAPMPTGVIAAATGVMMPARDLVAIEIEGAQAGPAAEAMREVVAGLNTLENPFAPQPTDADFAWVPGAGVEAVSASKAIVRSSLTRAATSVVERTKADLAEAADAIRGRYPGTRIDVAYDAGAIPGIINDGALTAQALEDARQVLPAEAVAELSTLIPSFSEDFGHFQNVMPGAFFFLGMTAPDAETPAMPHTPGFVADEDAIAIGARVMSHIMIAQMERLAAAGG